MMMVLENMGEREKARDMIGRFYLEGFHDIYPKVGVN